MQQRRQCEFSILRDFTKPGLAPRLHHKGVEGFSMFRNAILLVLFFVLLFAWILGWAAFHIASAGIHLLLVLAVIVLVAHFLRGRRAV